MCLPRGPLIIFVPFRWLSNWTKNEGYKKNTLCLEWSLYIHVINTDHIRFLYFRSKFLENSDKWMFWFLLDLQSVLHSGNPIFQDSIYSKLFYNLILISWLKEISSLPNLNRAYFSTRYFWIYVCFTVDIFRSILQHFTKCIALMDLKTDARYLWFF